MGKSISCKQSPGHLLLGLTRDQSRLMCSQLIQLCLPLYLRVFFDYMTLDVRGSFALVNVWQDTKHKLNN